MEEKRDCLQEYRGYIGSVEYSEEDGVFFGKLIGIRDLVSYEGKTLELLEKDYRKAVDFYLANAKNSEKSENG